MNEISPESKEKLLNKLSAAPAETANDLPRYLDQRDPECWYFRCRKVTLIPILFIVIIPIILAFFVSWIVLIYSAILILILSFTLKKAILTPTFDFRNRCYYCDWKKPRYGDMSTLRNHIPFSGIVAIQMLSKVVYGSKGSSHTAYEINIVSADGSRTTAAVLRDLTHASLYAKEIAEKLGVKAVENTHNKVPVKRVHLWLGILILTMFGACGIMGIITCFIRPLMENIDARSWIKTPAVVTSSQLSSKKQRSKHSSYTVYLATVKYNYIFNGRKYSGKRYNTFNGYTQRRSSQVNIIKQYPRGKNTVCFVNPAAPEKAVLNRDFSFWDLAKSTMPGLFFIGFGIVVFIIIFCKWKSQRR